MHSCTREGGSYQWITFETGPDFFVMQQAKSLHYHDACLSHCLLLFYSFQQCFVVAALRFLLTNTPTVAS